MSNLVGRPVTSFANDEGEPLHPWLRDSGETVPLSQGTIRQSDEAPCLRGNFQAVYVTLLLQN